MLLTKTEYLAEQQTQALVIIDSKVEAPQQLSAGIKTYAEALFLDLNRDSIAQITSALKNCLSLIPTIFSLLQLVT